MRQLAAEAGVSPSTLYKIYGSKDTLILNSIRSRLEEIGAEEVDVKRGLDRLLQRLETIGDFFQNTSRQAEAVSRLLFQDSNNDLSKEVLLRNAFQARKVSLEEMIAAGQIDRPGDLDLVARTLVSATWGTVLFHQRGELGRKGRVGRDLIRESISVLLPYAASAHVRRRMLKLIRPG
jgi:AcrR family transcriptional regulator